MLSMKSQKWKIKSKNFTHPNISNNPEKFFSLSRKVHIRNISCTKMTWSQSSQSKSQTTKERNVTLMSVNRSWERGHSFLRKLNKLKDWCPGFIINCWRKERLFMLMTELLLHRIRFVSPGSRVNVLSSYFCQIRHIFRILSEILKNRCSINFQIRISIKKNAK